MEMRKSHDDREAWRLEERRREARFTLILRVGILEQQGKSSLCLVKNISSSGIQLRFYSRPIADAEASIRVADEPSVRGRIVWIEGDIAGMRFDGELDTATLLRVQQKLRPNRRRSTPRISVDASATLRTGGRTCRATVCDISSLGARIRTRSVLTKGDRAVIAFADLPSLNAFVRWSDGGESGLVFETPIPMQIIAHWIEGRVGLSA
jgi:PilZ domain